MPKLCDYTTDKVWFGNGEYIAEAHQSGGRLIIDVLYLTAITTPKEI